DPFSVLTGSRSSNRVTTDPGNFPDLSLLRSLGSHPNGSLGEDMSELHVTSPHQSRRRAGWLTGGGLAAALVGLLTFGGWRTTDVAATAPQAAVAAAPATASAPVASYAPIV